MYTDPSFNCLCSWARAWPYATVGECDLIFGMSHAQPSGGVLAHCGGVATVVLTGV